MGQGQMSCRVGGAILCWEMPGGVKEEEEEVVVVAVVCIHTPPFT